MTAPDGNNSPVHRAAAFKLLMNAKESEFAAAVVFRNSDRQAVLRDELHALVDGMLDAQKEHLETIK